jgi:FkbM family methyltransferase
MLTITRHGITSNFDTSPWPGEAPSLYRPFLQGVFYEQGFLDHIRSLNLAGVYVDAGSCLGTHTVWFGLYCPSTEVHAFDPRERCARWTRMNVDANNLGGKTTVHNVGLGARRGRATVKLDDIDETFPVRRLDRIVRGRVAVLKIDVEGMEADVLRGARRILARSRPVVFAEAFTSAELAGIEQVLRPYGYKATGKVFNATPTYEFVSTGSARELALKRLARRLPAVLRRFLGQAYRRLQQLV